MTVTGKPENRGLEKKPASLNGMVCHRRLFAVKRIACNASQPGTGARVSAATDLWSQHWTRLRYQRSSGAASGRQGSGCSIGRMLDPDGCLVRFVATNKWEETGAIGSCKQGRRMNWVKRPAACAAMNSCARLTLVS